jgi:hypothetical protein
MTDRRDPSGSHLLLPPHPPMVVREDTTGSHRAQLPPDSDPPITSRGVSWKIIGALFAGVGTVLLIPMIIVLVQLGRAIELVEQLRVDVEDLRAEIAPLAERQRETELALAVLRRDVGALEREVEKMERRGRREGSEER